MEECNAARQGAEDGDVDSLANNSEAIPSRLLGSIVVLVPS